MTSLTQQPAAFEAHAVRGRLNAWFFAGLDGYLNSFAADRKRAVFSGLPPEVVEIGPGAGANLRYLPPGGRLLAIEPSPYMHGALRRRAARYGIGLEIRGAAGATTGLADQSADAVISSLVLCTVDDPAAVVREIRRILRPGGRYSFIEHVAAPDGTLLRTLQRSVRRPWRWAFEGCSCERDLAALIGAAGFESVEIDACRVRSPFVVVNTQIAGTAIA